MKLYGIEITKEQQEACLAAMKERFRASDIAAAAIAAGVPETAAIGKWRMVEYVAIRVADRMIQKQRKEGTIKRDGNHWVINH